MTYEKKRDCPGCLWDDAVVECSCNRKWCEQCMREHSQFTGCKLKIVPGGCSTCQSTDPFVPNIKGCLDCRAEATEIIREAETRAGWDPTP